MLNRVVRWTDEGEEYEADPRQAEKLLEELDVVGDGVNGVVTPGVKVASHQVQSGQPLPAEQHTKFRALAARANFLAADRPDGVMFAAKEVCRFMAKPTDLACRRLSG